jgi:hypothetical protein
MTFLRCQITSLHSCQVTGRGQTFESGAEEKGSFPIFGWPAPYHRCVTRRVRVRAKSTFWLQDFLLLPLTYSFGIGGYRFATPYLYRPLLAGGRLVYRRAASVGPNCLLLGTHSSYITYIVSYHLPLISTAIQEPLACIGLNP